MRVPLGWIAAAVMAGTVAASAASPVPPDAMPGRERDRFTQSPVERFMVPGPYVSTPVLTSPEGRCAIPRRSKHRTRQARPC
jgi:hypothetical protein